MDILTLFKAHLAKNKIKAESFHPYYEEALNYMLSNGGKHFRAQLLLGVVNALRPDRLELALDAALGLEMMHTYSLIHDDLPTMDNSALRRNAKTTHVKFDEVTALLVGDALNSHAFFMIANSNLEDAIKNRCTKILAYNAGAAGMVLGQALDCHFEKRKLNLDELIFLHNHKTGMLIAAAIQMGAVVAKMGDEECEKLYNLGKNLGLLFQIQDDLLDATSTQKEAGKPTNNDIFKNSFTNLLGIDGAKNYKSNLISQIEKNAQEFHPKIRDLIRNLIEKYLKG